MSYLDRLRTAKYTAPSGQSYELQFDEVERRGGKKASVVEFPQIDLADVQDLGNTATRFPLTCYISGADYDQTADQFYNALAERGPGTLTHPRYGDLQVLALSWTQQEKFVEGMGRAEFQIEFIIAPDVSTYPRTDVNLDVATVQALDNADALGAAAFAQDFVPANAAEELAARQATLSILDQINAGAQAIVAGSEELAAEFNQAVREIETNIDSLLQAPALLAQALARVARLPATAFETIKAKVNAYAGIIAGAIGSIPRSYAGIIAFVQGLFAVASGTIESAVSENGTSRSRDELVFSQGVMAQALADLAVTIEAAEALSFEVATGAPDPAGKIIVIGAQTYTAPTEVLEALQEAEALAAASLIEKAFSLPTERRIVLDADRTPLELVWQFYEDLDRLDELIETNGLGGEELFLVPAGRGVLYYE